MYHSDGVGYKNSANERKICFPLNFCPLWKNDTNIFFWLTTLIAKWEIFSLFKRFKNNPSSGLNRKHFVQISENIFVLVLSFFPKLYAWPILIYLLIFMNSHNNKIFLKTSIFHVRFMFSCLYTLHTHSPSLSLFCALYLPRSFASIVFCTKYNIHLTTFHDMLYYA